MLERLRRPPSWTLAGRRLALALAVAGAGCAAESRPHGEDTERAETVRSAVVGGEVSTTADDFVVFVSLANNPRDCGGTLVAPNVVLTAKHCLYEYLAGTGSSLCDASGEPQPGSTGGYVTAPHPVANLGIYPGADGRKRSLEGGSPAAVGKAIVDDGSPSLCSYDLAYLILDRPVENVPLGRLRLGKRPDAGPASRIALAGWGVIENRLKTQVRMRRGGIGIQRVGPPVAEPDATGSLGPRTFETGPAGCTGDSGSPGFDESTGAVLGVLARALNLDQHDPVSPCRPETVTNVYMTVADSPDVLRTAFAAAEAEPWLEGREAPGYARFGEECFSGLECEGEACVGGSDLTPGTCNVDCTKAPLSCPDGFTCSARGNCEAAAADDAGSTDDAGPETPPPPSSTGCSSAPSCPTGNAPFGAGAILLGACLALARSHKTRNGNLGSKSEG
jgi:hypothetical protein